MRVTLQLENFPNGLSSTISGFSGWPRTAPVGTLGTHASQGLYDETALVTVPKSATPGYLYYIELTHDTGPLDLLTAVQVCTFKASASSVRKGTTVTLRGIVPTLNHWGTQGGKRKYVYLLKRSKPAAQPLPGKDPTKQGWTFVGRYTTDPYGKFTMPRIKVNASMSYVVLYAGDRYYWPGYTKVIRVTAR